jgi:hypothetical protein
MSQYGIVPFQHKLKSAIICIKPLKINNLKLCSDRPPLVVDQSVSMQAKYYIEVNSLYF